MEHKSELLKTHLKIVKEKAKCSNVHKDLQKKDSQNKSSGKIYLITPIDKQKKVVAVIVTFLCGESYDELFRKIQQKSIEETQVLVYLCPSHYIDGIIKGFKGQSQDSDIISLMGYIQSVDPDCVLFNWQCCSSYQSKKFQQGKNFVFQLLKIIVQCRFMAMFSDFSLKALINQWNQQNFGIGPNPFRIIGQFQNIINLKFKGEVLKKCPSLQLQIVGDLAQEEVCYIQSMPQTIVYTVDQEVKHDEYALQVLTVVTNIKIKQNHLRCKIGEFQGAAGHVLLKYKSGGTILTSMGHWIELMKIDTSEKKLFETAQRQYGKQTYNLMRSQYTKMDHQQKKSWLQEQSRRFVQSQAPCLTMYRKTYL